jgi:hypothetical protein
MFWDLSPESLAMIAEGHITRTERDWYRSAWMAVHFLSPYRKKGKKAPKPHELLGWPSPKGPRKRR